MSAGVQVIGSLLGGINANAPAIMASGMSILQTLLEGASSILPEIGPLVVNIITFLGDGVFDRRAAIAVDGRHTADQRPDRGWRKPSQR